MMMHNIMNKMMNNPAGMEKMQKMMSDPATMQKMVSDPQMGRQMLAELDPELLRAMESDALKEKDYLYDGAEVAFTEGNEHIEANEYSKALERFDMAIKNLSPYVGTENECKIRKLQAKLLSSAATCHLHTNNFAKAKMLCTQALELDATASKALYRRGLANEGMGEIAEAMRDVQAASDSEPENFVFSDAVKRLEKLTPIDTFFPDLIARVRTLLKKAEDVEDYPRCKSLDNNLVKLKLLHERESDMMIQLDKKKAEKQVGLQAAQKDWDSLERDLKSRKGLMDLVLSSSHLASTKNVAR